MLEKQSEESKSHHNKQEESNSSISCSLNQSVDLEGIIDKISSGHSSDIDCDFQNNCDINYLDGVNDYYKNSKNQMKVIPTEIKDLTNQFCNDLFLEFNSRNTSNPLDLKIHLNINPNNNDDNKTITTMIKTGFLDGGGYKTASISSDKETSKLREELLINANEIKGNKKTFEEPHFIPIIIEDDMINQDDNKDTLLKQNKAKPHKHKKNNEKKISKPKSVDSQENLIDDSLL